MKTLAALRAAAALSGRGTIRNLFLKYPGWRAREGHSQPAFGFPGLDPCAPACPGEFTRGPEAP